MSGTDRVIAFGLRDLMSCSKVVLESSGLVGTQRRGADHPELRRQQAEMR